MLKFLRKYNKILLVVGGSFLMVAFLAPQAIQYAFVNPQAQTMFVIDSEKVSAGELSERERERAALEIFLSRLHPTPGLIVGQSAAHWIMLTKAAEEAGFVGERGDGSTWQDAFVPQLVRLEARRLARENPSQELDPEQIRARVVTQLNQLRLDARSRARLTDAQFDLALARARGVDRMIRAYLSANRLPQAPVMVGAAERLETAEVDWVLIPGAEARSVPEPTEADLREQFEAYRDQRPSENELGIGYVLPARVKLEYLKLDRAAIEQYVRIPRYQVIQEYNLAEEEPGDREAALERIESRLHRERVSEILATADRVVRRRVAARTRALEVDSGYRVIEPGWAMPRMEDLADTLWAELDERFGRGSAESEGVELEPLPRPEVTVLDASWRTRAELGSIEGIGSSRTRVGTQNISFPDLVMGVREIAGRNSLRLQVGVPAVHLAMEDPTGSRYYFTILDARKQSPAESLAVVRERVEEDYRAVAGFRELKSRLGELERVASSEGLDAVAALFEGHETDGTPPGEDAEGGDAENSAGDPDNETQEGQDQGGVENGPGGVEQEQEGETPEPSGGGGDGDGQSPESDTPPDTPEDTPEDQADEGTGVQRGSASVRRAGVRVQSDPARFDTSSFRQLVDAVMDARARGEPINDQQLTSAIFRVAIQSQPFDPEAARRALFEVVERQEALNTEAFREAVFEVVRGLDPLTPVEDVTRSERVFGVALPGARSVAAGEVTSYRPLTLEAYRRQALQVAQQVRSRELLPEEAEPVDAFSRVFGFDALAERYGFEDRRPQDVEAPDADQQDTADQEPGESESSE